jgi:hypothetical protein
MTGLLTIENLKTRQARAGAIVGGLVGLLGIFITNIDKMIDAYRYFFESTENTNTKGPWLGVFRELSLDGKSYRVSTESLNVQPSRDHITGTIDSSDPIARHHDIKGSIRDGFLVVEYRSGKPPRVGATVYLLNGEATSGSLTGFWTGYDPDERVLMSCPYVLTRNVNLAAVTAQFKQWLDKDCLR